MRTLKFIVEGQIVKMDSAGDFSGLVPGSDGYVSADFTFSSEWDGCGKVAGFFSPMGVEYPPQVLKDNSCMIPIEALKRRSFKMQLIGVKPNYQIITNRITIKQDGGVVK